MQKLLSLALGVFLISWLMNFDADAYHARRQAYGQETILDDSTDLNVPSSTSGEYIFPLAGKTRADVISGYGDVRAGGKRTHEGIDVPAERGTPVLAVADGRIEKVAHKGNGGKQVWLRANGKSFFYAHLDDWKVEEGQEVKQGDVIGTVGNTGNASKTLPHLHFGVYVGRGLTMNPEELYAGSRP